MGRSCFEKFRDLRGNLRGSLRGDLRGARVLLSRSAWPVERRVAEGHFETFSFFEDWLGKINAVGFPNHLCDAATPLLDQARVKENLGNQPISRHGCVLSF